MEEDTDSPEATKRNDVNTELEEILKLLADLDRKRALFNAQR